MSLSFTLLLPSNPSISSLFFTVLLVLQVFIIRREIITERPRATAQIYSSLVPLFLRIRRVRSHIFIQIFALLYFFTGEHIWRTGFSPVTILSSRSQLDFVKAIVNRCSLSLSRARARSLAVALNFPSPYAAFVRSTPLFRSLPSTRLAVLIVFNFLPLPAFLLASPFPVALCRRPALTTGIIITFSPPTREVEEWKKRVVLIILSRDRQPRPLFLPLRSSNPLFVLRDIGCDETRDVTDVSLISPYWLWCRRDAYINFSVRDAEENSLY